MSEPRTESESALNLHTSTQSRDRERAGICRDVQRAPREIQAIPKLYEAVARACRAAFLDEGGVTPTDGVDGLHLSAEAEASVFRKAVGLDGGFVHSCEENSKREGRFEVIPGKSVTAEGDASALPSCTNTTRSRSGGYLTYSSRRGCSTTNRSSFSPAAVIQSASW